MSRKPGFATFYNDHYLAEHRLLPNIALHCFGTIAGIALIGAVLIGWIPYWWALAFPIVHAAPGLIGHRLFERNQDVGDNRITRTDFPLYWFIIANHIFLWNLITKRK